LTLTELIATECPGATIELFPNSDSVLVKFRTRSILLMDSTIRLGESAIRARLKSLVPRSVKTTRGRPKGSKSKKKVVDAG